jgi:hypothetical protein
MMGLLSAAINLESDESQDVKRIRDKAWMYPKPIIMEISSQAKLSIVDRKAIRPQYRNFQLSSESDYTFVNGESLTISWPYDIQYWRSHSTYLSQFENWTQKNLINLPPSQWSIQAIRSDMPGWTQSFTLAHSPEKVSSGQDCTAM